MKQHRLTAVRQRFPALFAASDGKYLYPVGWVQNVHVRRVDMDLLGRMPYEMGHSNGDEDDTVLLFDQAWAELGRVQPEIRADGRVRQRGETIGDAIERLGIENSLYAIVWVMYVRVGCSVSAELTVYLRPKGWTIPQWADDARAAARAPVRCFTCECWIDLDTDHAEGCVAK